jgi:hypothetical protein
MSRLRYTFTAPEGFNGPEASAPGRLRGERRPIGPGSPRGRRVDIPAGV